MEAVRSNARDATGEADDADGKIAVGVGAVPELARSIGAPALDRADIGERACVPAARGDRRDAARQSDNIHRGGAIGSRTVPELAGRVVTPALHAAGARERACVVVASG